MDNRPLRFDEFETLQNQVLYVSATPADYELERSGGVVVEQIIRPTGLLDPIIEVRPSKNQVDDLMEEIHKRVDLDERVLVTTLTKRMAEELTKFLTRYGVRCRYIHSDVETMERIEIMDDLREGQFDVLIGVNLLREGLDFPQVSLVAILDADKEGFLRSERSLVQTVGRAARNVNGKAIFYADKITNSMQRTLDETARRRTLQEAYNLAHNQVPTAIAKKAESLFSKKRDANQLREAEKKVAQEPELRYQSTSELDQKIALTRKAMETAAKNLDFLEAARYRDQLKALDVLRKKSQE
jgi:excinuclease ABC subunit B